MIGKLVNQWFSSGHMTALFKCLGGYPLPRAGSEVSFLSLSSQAFLGPNLLPEDFLPLPYKLRPRAEHFLFSESAHDFWFLGSELTCSHDLSGFSTNPHFSAEEVM